MLSAKRHLEALASQGHLDKVHDGATTKRSPSTEEPGFEVKRVLQPAPNVILTGGVRTPSDALDPRAGYTTPNMLEADTDRALVAAGRRLVVVADHTKWATVGISTIVELDQADVVVTDDSLPAAAQEVLRESVGELVVADRGAPLEATTEHRDDTGRWPPGRRAGSRVRT